MTQIISLFFPFGPPDIFFYNILVHMLLKGEKLYSADVHIWQKKSRLLSNAARSLLFNKLNFHDDVTYYDSICFVFLFVLSDSLRLHYACIFIVCVYIQGNILPVWVSRVDSLVCAIPQKHVKHLYFDVDVCLISAILNFRPIQFL